MKSNLVMKMDMKVMTLNNFLIPKKEGLKKATFKANKSKNNNNKNNLKKNSPKKYPLQHHHHPLYQRKHLVLNQIIIIIIIITAQNIIEVTLRFNKKNLKLKCT